MSTHNICCEAILMSTHNIGFYGELTKIILQLSSDTLLICSSEFKTQVSTIYFQIYPDFMFASVKPKKWHWSHLDMRL